MRAPATIMVATIVVHLVGSAALLGVTSGPQFIFGGTSVCHVWDLADAR
jgi:hypothetical protein